MMKSLVFSLASAAMLFAVATASAQADAAPEPSRAGAPWSGTWKNTNNTMHVRAARCGDAMCGTVVWADDKSKAEIAEKGRTLVGTQVFRDFRQTGPNEWKGMVYVPALDKTIGGKILLTDPETIAASACIFGPIGCQIRHYQRIR